MLYRFPKLSSSRILSPGLLFRAVFIAALIALIYGLQMVAEPNSSEEEPAQNVGAYLFHTFSDR